MAAVSFVGLWLLRSAFAAVSLWLFGVLWRLCVRWLGLKLMEDAVIGWLNSQISEAFEIKSPSASKVVLTISEWTPTVAFAFLFLALIAAGVATGWRLRELRRRFGGTIWGAVLFGRSLAEAEIPSRQTSVALGPASPAAYDPNWTPSDPAAPRGLASIFAGDAAHTSGHRTNEQRARRRALIFAMRQSIAQWAQEQIEDREFWTKVQSIREFYELRPHLSKEFMDAFYKPRTAYIRRRGAPLPVLADRLLKEMERLEQEWELK